MKNLFRSKNSRGSAILLAVFVACMILVISVQFMKSSLSRVTIAHLEMGSAVARLRAASQLRLLEKSVLQNLSTVAEGQSAPWLPIDLNLANGTESILRPWGDLPPGPETTLDTYQVECLRQGTEESATPCDINPDASENPKYFMLTYAARGGSGAYYQARSHVQAVVNQGGPTGVYDPVVDVPLEEEGLPNDVALADANCDGKNDLFVLRRDGDGNGPATGEVFVFRGDGDGGFDSSNPTRVVIGQEACNLRVRDLNGDGVMDFLTSDRADHRVSVRLGNGTADCGDGTFRNSPTGDIGFTFSDFPQFVESEDIDGDNIPDLMAVIRNSGRLRVMLGNGDGTFRNFPEGTVNYSSGTGTPGPIAVKAADMNGDGIRDMVALNNYNHDVAIFYGKSGAANAGRFETTPILVGLQQFVDPCWVAGAYDLVLRDINGDGRSDVIALDKTGNKVTAYMNNGDWAGARGEFGWDVMCRNVGSSPSAMAVEDMDKDGFVDIVVANGEPNGTQNTLSILSGKDNFTTQRRINTPSKAGGGIALGQLTANDDYLDIALAEDGTLADPGSAEAHVIIQREGTTGGSSGSGSWKSVATYSEIDNASIDEALASLDEY